MLLLIGSGFGWLWRRTEESRQHAEESRHHAEEARYEADQARDQADEARQESEQLSSWILELLEGRSENQLGLEGFHLRVPPNVGQERKVAEILQRGVLRAKRSIETGDSSPQTQASVLDAIGNAYRVLGLLPEAEKLLREAHKIREKDVGHNQLSLAASYHSLGSFRHERGRLELSDYDEAERYYNLALEIRKREDPTRELVCQTLLNQAWLYSELQDEEKARGCLQHLTAELHSRKVRDDDPELLRVQIAQECMELEWQGRQRWVAGVPHVIKLVKSLLKAERNGNLLNAVDSFNTGVLEKISGEGILRAGGLQVFANPFFSKAEANFDECLNIADGALGERHLLAAVHLFSAETQANARKDEAAEESYKKALDVIQESVGYQHQMAPLVVKGYAGFLARKGRLPEAKSVFEEVLKAHLDRFGPNHFFVAQAKMTYADFLEEQGLFAEQAKVAREALAIYEHPLCPEGPKKKHQEECRKIAEDATRKINPLERKATD